MEAIGDLLRNGALVVATFGYTGIFVAMLIEASGIPLPFPGTVLLAFVGYAVWRGNLNTAEASIAAATGSSVGALILYRVARDAGSELLVRYGHRLALTPEKINRADSWFRTHAGRATFFARLTPGVRIYISVAAGLARMNQAIFLISTFAGAWLWAALIIGLGWALGEGWRTAADVLGFVQTTALLVVALAVVLVTLSRRGSDEPRIKP